MGWYQPEHWTLEFMGMDQAELGVCFFESLRKGLCSHKIDLQGAYRDRQG